MSAAETILEPRPVVCVGRRVDWLTIAFRVRFHKSVLQHFVTTADERPPKDAPFAVRAYLCRKYRIASVALDLFDALPTEEPAVFRMKMAGEGKTILENGSCRVVLHENAPRSPDDNPNEPGWTLAVEWSGTSLIETDYEEAVRQSFRIAKTLGDVMDVRLRRLDLCADMAGFEIPVPEGHGWCTRPQLRSRKMRAAKRCPIPKRVRSQNANFGRRLLRKYEDGDIDYDALLDAFPDIDDTYYYPESQCTGWKFGKGVISARVYDKQAEMRMRIARAGGAADRRKQAGDKKEAEEGWWRAHGWDGRGKVTRVEVQCRGEVLHELDARCDRRFEGGDAEAYAAELGDQLDRVWAYFAGAPDELARREPPPKDAEGRCSRCKVIHKSDASCKHTLAPKSGWLRQIVLEADKGRSECSHTPAWEAVQRVVFKNAVKTIPTRRRKRGAVRATQALGCLLALLGYTEQLEHPVDPVTGEIIVDKDEDLHAKEFGAPRPIRAVLSAAERKRMEEVALAQAKDRTREQVLVEIRRICARGADEIAETLNWIHEEKPEDALALVWTRINAARARWKPLAKAPARLANDTEATA
jgi:hypothetical protein